MMRNTMQVFLLARTRSLVIAMCSQQEPRRGSVVVSISFLHNHNRPSPRLDAIQCSCHQAALNRFAIFACMVFRMMRHLRCQYLLLFHFHLFYFQRNWRIITQGHAFGMFRCNKQQCINASLTNQKNRPFGLPFRCKQQCINALETCRRHVPTF